jgi:hypothetical protein
MLYCWLGHIKGRDPVDGKIILKLISKNCDVLVGLDLSGFQYESLHPCPFFSLPLLSSWANLVFPVDIYSPSPVLILSKMTPTYRPNHYILTFFKLSISTQNCYVKKKCLFLWVEPIDHKHNTGYQIQSPTSATDIHTNSIWISFFHTRSDQPKLRGSWIRTNTILSAGVVQEWYLTMEQGLVRECETENGEVKRQPVIFCKERRK